MPESRQEEKDIWGLSVRDRVFSRAAQRLLLRRFRIPRQLEFFLIYNELFRAYQEGLPEERDYYGRFIRSARIAQRLLKSDVSQAAFNDVLPKLRSLLRRLDSLDRVPNQVWFQISKYYAAAIEEVAISRGVYIKPIPKMGDPRWFYFRRMSDDEAELERLKREDPELYEAKQTLKDLRKQRDEAIKEFAAQGGEFEERRLLAHHPPFVIGRDPVTGERVVFDLDGERIKVHPVPPGIKDEKQARKIAFRDFYDKYRRKNRRDRVFLPERELDALREFDDETIQIGGEGPVYDVAMTDDLAKAHNLTRILKVQKVRVRADDGTERVEEVVVAGRFKGIPVHNLINRAGRMIEGVAFDYDTTSKRAVPLRPLETKGPDGEVQVQVTREPYITVRNQRLFLTIPNTHGYSGHRQAIRALAKKSKNSGINLVTYTGSRMLSAEFDPESFETVKEILGGVALSQAAVRKLQEYYEKLAGHERALSEKNLRNYEAEAIGGLKKTHPKGGEIKLRTHQKEAVAVLEVRGWNGVIALDTGMGKTLVGITSMLKMLRDGVGEGSSNGKFLVVAPTALQGNFIQEIHAFVQNPKSLLDRIDTMSHSEFRSMVKRDPGFADDYIAVFIDEGDVLGNPNNKLSRAVQKCKNPRKIILTASPMKKDPIEARVLIGIANGEDYSRKEDKKRLRAFVAKYTKKIGGRTVGVTDDPALAKELRVFMRQNMFFRDKMLARDMEVPRLERSVSTLPMDPVIENLYRQESAEIAHVLRGMVRKWRDLDPKAKDPAIEAARIKLADVLGRLQRLSNNPDEVHLERFKTQRGGWGPLKAALAERGIDIRDDDTPEQVSLHVISLHPVQRQAIADSLESMDPDAAEDLKPLLDNANPKLARAAELIEDGVSMGDRFIIWTDSPDYAKKTVAYLSRVLPAKKHVIGLSDAIEVWEDGSLVKKYTKRRYRDREGRMRSNREWKSVLLAHFQDDPQVLTLTLTGSYAFGLNLQAFNRVIHLDRDTWNTQKMEQRTARAHRFGALKPVEEEVLDATFSNPTGTKDATLDEIRAYLMQLEGKVFNDFIVQAQSEALGESWFKMKRLPASLVEANRDIQEITFSPYIRAISTKKGL